MKQSTYVLTEEDMQVIDKSRTDGRWFGDFYLRKPGAESGFVFDHQIETPWQLAFHHADQRDLSLITGIGTGKTVVTAVSAATWACTTANFKFLNLAPLAWQSQQMFDQLITLMTGTPLAERFLFKYVRKPYPKIIFRHSGIGESIMEFMSLGDNSEKILTYEGDWINVDQAEQLQNLDEVLTNLRTRLRGTVGGRPRLARLSLLANSSYDADPALWYRFDLGRDIPDEYLSIQVATTSNRNLTDRQVKDIVKNIPEHDRDRVLRGDRPEGSGKEFSSATVELAETNELAAIMAANRGKPGFEVIEAQRCGVVHWEMPYDPYRHYALFCDPGQGLPPGRNAPVIVVLDITDYPVGPVVERAFWWGFGHGSYDPFVAQFRLWNLQYACVHGVHDATGGQKAFAEFPFRDLVNLVPMDMSGVKKMTAHTTLKLLLGKGLVKFAPIAGRRRQFLNYAFPDTKLAQDTVAVYQLFGGYAFNHLGLPAEPNPEDEEAAAEASDRYARPLADREGAGRQSA